jgi:PAS domain S-box-containing protein
MFKNLPLKYRLIFGGIAAVLIPFALLGTIIYIQLSKSLVEMTQLKSLHYVEDMSALINATLEQEIRLARSVAADPDMVEALKSGSYPEAQEELVEIYNSIRGDYFTLFLLDSQGIVRAEAFYPEQIGLDLSDRDYFLDARKGKAGVSGPLLSKGRISPGEPIILVYTPVQEKETFHGVVVIAFDAQFITDILLRQKTGQTGIAFLIDSDGLVLVHPEKKHTLTLRLLDQPGLEQMKELVRSGKQGAVTYTSNAVERIAGVANVALTDWKVVFSEELREVMQPANRLLFVIFISGLTVLLITTGAIVLFSGRISTPIQKVLKVMGQVTRHSTDIIVQIGADRKIVFANPAFETITGLKAKDIVGAELDFSIHGGTTPAVLWETLESGKTWSGRIILNETSTDPITLSVMFIPVKDQKGAIEGYLEIGRNISGELMYEKRLQQAQKLEAIGTLAGGIAHDFNNILSGIFGYAELSLLDGGCDLRSEEYIKEIIKASERARELVNQILTFSRRAKVQLAPLCSETVVKEVLKLLRASIPATIDIQSDIKCNSHIMAEPTQIHQILMNLVTNAVHAIGDGPGTIRLELEDFMVGEAFVKAHPEIGPGKHLMLRVSDSGRGIEKEVLDQIFEPFFTTKSQGEGTGLGLSVVHGIVKKLGGIITAYSEIGKGTAFSIIIPIVDAPDAPQQKGALRLREGTERIIIVDDETAITSSMQSILENLGYRVRSFTNATAALAAMTAEPDGFDLVITDYSMPQITGVELVKKIKEAGIHVPVIMVSGFVGKKVEDAARHAGVSVLIGKPVSVYQLTDALHQVFKTGQ